MCQPPGNPLLVDLAVLANEIRRIRHLQEGAQAVRVVENRCCDRLQLRRLQFRQPLGIGSGLSGLRRLCGGFLERLVGGGQLLVAQGFEFLLHGLDVLGCNTFERREFVVGLPIVVLEVVGALGIGHL